MTTKTKGRGPDKQKRKSRKGTMTKPKPKSESESGTVSPGIIQSIIDAVSAKIKKETREPWSLDVGPRVKSQMLGRHVFKSDDVIEIDLGKL